MTANKSTNSYPDRSDIYARKEQGRRESVRRSLGEKIAMVEAMRERLLPLKMARQAANRQRAREKPQPEN